MMMEMSLIRERDGVTVASIDGDVSEDGDIDRLYELLIAEFRLKHPNESLLDAHRIVWDEVTKKT